MAITSFDDRRTAPLSGWPVVLWLGLVAGELLTASYLFDFAAQVPERQNPVYYVTRAARWVAISVPLLVVLAWSERHRLAADWMALEAPRSRFSAIGVNLAIFAVFAVACAAFTAHAAAASAPPWHLLPGLGLLLLATGLSLLRIAVSLRSLIGLAWALRRHLLAAGGAGLVIVVLADIALGLWQSLAGATLLLSAAILRLYEPEIAIDIEERSITVGDFTALVWETCSGYEGLALVAGFVTIYLWTFRNELRFPLAFLLYPIGLGASFLLNSVRIAVLTSIGGHLSPEMAVKGFHSQAGWIAFLLIALGLMALSHRVGLIERKASPVLAAGGARAPSVRYVQTEAYLLPFIAMMVGSIAMAASVPHQQPVYVLKAALVVVALWVVRNRWESWRLHVSSVGVGAGVLVGVAWIATNPDPESGSALADWLTEIGPQLAVGWLIVRGVGTIVLVPIAEELAFRGFLYRRLIARDFFAVSPARLSWIALIVSSVLFGVLHDRWLAGALAGAVFAVVMLRTGRLGDAIVAHMAANAVIFAWALGWHDWSLL